MGQFIQDYYNYIYFSIRFNLLAKFSKLDKIFFQNIYFIFDVGYL